MSVPEEQPTEDLLRSLRVVHAVQEDSDAGPEVLGQRRERMVSSIQATMANLVAERRRRTRWIRASVLAAGIAASFALTWGLGQKLTTPLHGTSSAMREEVAVLDQAAGVFSGADGRRLQAGSALVTGSELRTEPSGFARMALGQRATIEVRGDTQLYLEELQAKRHKLSLQRGRVEVDVLKIPGAPEQLLVATPDAEVEVKGTAFSVERKMLLGAWVTTVHVTRGRVLVRSKGRSIELGPAESFVSSAQDAEGRAKELSPALSVGTKEAAQLAAQERPSQVVPAQQVSEQEVPQPERIVRGGPGRAEQPRSLKPSLKGASDGAAADQRELKTGEPRSETSTLGEQNRLFERALLARDQGRDAEAIALLTELMTHYPSSPLSRSAQEEVRRARVRLGK